MVSTKLVLCLILFCAVTWNDAKENKITKKRHLSDEERLAAYKAALPENRRRSATGPVSKESRADHDHERVAGQNTRQLRANGMIS